MPVVQDTLWKNPGQPGLIVVSSHASVDADGRLLMDYEPACEALRRIPDIDQQCGEEVQRQAVDGVYGFLLVRPPQPNKRKIGFGLFQTRIGLEEPDHLVLIQRSMNALREYSVEHADVKIRMDFPGVHDGGLAVDEVAPVLLPLPETVTVCHQGEVVRTYPQHFPGFKEIYVRVEHMLKDNKFDEAVEFLLENGFDIQSAIEQVHAVQRILHDRETRNEARMRRWRQVHTQLRLPGT